MKIIGEIDTAFYRLTVMEDDPPSQFTRTETKWLYITKHGADGRIERQSVGIGMSCIDGLLQILQRASLEYRGKRKEFRVKSSEFEQRAMSWE
jgi:hypothetical protein